MEIFAKASKQKLRFDFSKGQLSTEDLWQLKLTDLNEIAKKVSKAIKDNGEETFLSTPTSTDKKVVADKLRLDILKEVISVKETAAKASKERTEKLAQLENLKQIIATKKGEELANKSIDELTQLMGTLSVDESDD